MEHYNLFIDHTTDNPNKKYSKVINNPLIISSKLESYS